MTNDEHISEISSAFLEALKAAAQDLAGEYMKRLRTELQPSLPGRNFAPVLRDGAALLSSTGAQSDTLEALLDAAARVTPACGLMVLHGTLANGWNCRGITSTTTFKRAILDCSRGIAAHVVSTCSAAETPVSELDPALVSRLGLYGKSRVGLVPILLRDRPVALLLALLPMGDELAALEVLAQIARMTLELQFYRSAASEHTGAEHAAADHAVAAEAAPEMHESAAHAAVPQATHEPASEPASALPESAAPVAEHAAPEHVAEVEQQGSEAHADAEPAVEAAVPAGLPSTRVEEFAAPLPTNESQEPSAKEEDEHAAAGHEAPAEVQAAEPVVESHAETGTVEEIHPYVNEQTMAQPEHAAVPEIEVAPVAPAAYAEPESQPEPVAVVYPEPAPEPKQPEPEPETIQVRELPVYEAPVEPAAAPPAPEEHHAPAAAERWHAPAPPPPTHVPPAAHEAPVYPKAPHGYPPAYPAAGFVATPPAPPAPSPAPYSTSYNSPYGTPYGAPPAPHQVPPSYAAPAPSATGYVPPQPRALDPAHEKARRFAKLLVEEIKLYNQSKVAEGRARGDLYQRLREDIEKSRSAYRKRYGQTVSDVDYFTQELLRILADNNRALMGAGFPG